MFERVGQIFLPEVLTSLLIPLNTVLMKSLILTKYLHVLYGNPTESQEIICRKNFYKSLL